MAQTLRAFMKEQAEKVLNIEYVASQRFKDEHGEPIAWELRSLSNAEVDAIYKRNTRTKVVKATRTEVKDTDMEKIALEMTLASVVFPDLNDESLQADYAVSGPDELLKEMLTPGEFADLINAATEAAGFKAGMEDKIKTVKNS